MTSTRSQHILGGLCLTCNHAHGCALSREGAVLDCEEFDDVGPVGMWSIIPPQIEAQVQPTQEVLGLCADCVHAEDCHLRALSNAHHGVWRCAEYR